MPPAPMHSHLLPMEVGTDLLATLPLFTRFYINPPTVRVWRRSSLLPNTFFIVYNNTFGSLYDNIFGKHKAHLCIVRSVLLEYSTAQRLCQDESDIPRALSALDRSRVYIPLEHQQPTVPFPTDKIFGNVQVSRSSWTAHSPPLTFSTC